MVVSEDQDGKAAVDVSLDNTTESISLNTRQGGKPVETHTKQFIIVDMREFRSELPALLHKKGIDIEPVQITVNNFFIISFVHDRYFYSTKIFPNQNFNICEGGID